METNTVLLNLKDYNDLRDFKKKISKGYVCIQTITNGRYTYGDSTTYISSDELVKKLLNDIKTLTEENINLKENKESEHSITIKSLKEHISELKDTQQKMTIEYNKLKDIHDAYELYLKNMNFFEFYKWKRKK